MACHGWVPFENDGRNEDRGIFSGRKRGSTKMRWTSQCSVS
jgi:hypothetical protein